MEVTVVKMLDAEAGRIGGYLVVWDDADQRDLQGEYFTPQTDVGLDWYSSQTFISYYFISR